MLPFANAHDADPARWLDDLQEVAIEGFTDVDLTDTWVRVGDLDSDGRAHMAQALQEAAVRPVAVSVIRGSVVDPLHGIANLEYSHRAIDAAADLGSAVVSVGLHRPLTDAQRAAFWFWTETGAVDDESAEAWMVAVERLRELGRHAEELGLQLSLEMYEDTLLGSAQSAVRLVHDIDLPNVGLNPDLANIYRLHRPSQPFLEAVRLCMPIANYWHVKSYYRDVDPATGAVIAVPAPMSSGSMDYRAAVKIAIAAGFDAPFCVEHYGGDGLTVMADNSRYLRRLLEIALRQPSGQSRRAHGSASHHDGQNDGRPAGRTSVEVQP